MLSVDSNKSSPFAIDNKIKIVESSTKETQTAHKAKSKSLHTHLLELLDIVVSCLVVAPCVIAYWRSSWELLGELIYPNNLPMSALISLIIGVGGHFLFTLTQSFFKNNIHPDKGRLTYYIVSRCYTAIFGIVCVSMWRGSWLLCDWLTSTSSLMIISIVTLISLLFLVVTRTVRNLVAAPYTVTMDHKSDYYEVETMFKIPGLQQPGLYILDTFFSVFVVGQLVVIAWRGLWGITDLTLYPDNQARSAWSSMLMGYAAAFATFLVHPLVSYICKRVNSVLKLIISDVFFFGAFFGAVQIWRGVWNLLDVYIFSENRILSYWLTHLITFLVLAALKCANSILTRGVLIDGEGTGGECVDIPINYIKLHFERERSKKFICRNMQHNQYNHNHIHYHNHNQQTLKLHLHNAHEKDKEAGNPLLEKPNKTMDATIQNTMEVTSFPCSMELLKN